LQVGRKSSRGDGPCEKKTRGRMPPLLATLNWLQYPRCAIMVSWPGCFVYAAVMLFEENL